MWLVALVGLMTGAEPADGGVSKSPSSKRFAGGGVAAGVSMFGGPLVRGAAAEAEQKKLAALGSPARCSDRACFEQAFARCAPAQFIVPVFQGRCALEEKREPLYGWYATQRGPRGGCQVVLFAARGADVVVDRSCSAMPLVHYDFACPDDAEVRRSVELSQGIKPPPRRQRR
ncbi:MAG: hypothetical protein MUC96_29430 [Myxococcaceae bacterium]|jgi:hypothetical protein|nr:hypothetical protein [Myxococcaceae bacterium]